MDIKVKLQKRSIVIRLNGIKHLDLKRKGLLAIQSWKQFTTQEDISIGFKGEQTYCIEYSYKGGQNIFTQYDNIELWKEILNKVKI